jgi:hypothetical protein
MAQPRVNGGRSFPGSAIPTVAGENIHQLSVLFSAMFLSNICRETTRELAQTERTDQMVRCKLMILELQQEGAGATVLCDFRSRSRSCREICHGRK